MANILLKGDQINKGVRLEKGNQAQKRGRPKKAISYS